jgi:hypothetical protein
VADSKKPNRVDAYEARAVAADVTVVSTPDGTVRSVGTVTSSWGRGSN